MAVAQLDRLLAQGKYCGRGCAGLVRRQWGRVRECASRDYAVMVTEPGRLATGGGAGLHRTAVHAALRRAWHRGACRTERTPRRTVWARYGRRKPWWGLGDLLVAGLRGSRCRIQHLSSWTLGAAPMDAQQYAEPAGLRTDGRSGAQRAAGAGCGSTGAQPHGGGEQPAQSHPCVCTTGVATADSLRQREGLAAGGRPRRNGVYLRGG